MTYVVSMASSKGGVGKSTTVMVVGGELRRRGLRILGLDADPERRLHLWARDRADPDFVVIPGIDESNINATISEMAADYDFVFCDLAGFGSLTMLYAIGRSDLVLIPTLTSAMDRDATIKTHRLARDAAEQLRHAAPAVAFLNRTSAALRPRTLSHVRQELEEAGVPLLPVELIDRQLIVEASYVGRGPSEVDPGSKGAANVIALTDAILEELARIPPNPSIPRKKERAS